MFCETKLFSTENSSVSTENHSNELRFTTNTYFNIILNLTLNKFMFENYDGQ